MEGWKKTKAARDEVLILLRKRRNGGSPTFVVASEKVQKMYRKKTSPSPAEADAFMQNPSKTGRKKGFLGVEIFKA